MSGWLIWAGCVLGALIAYGAIVSVEEIMNEARKHWR